jgi:hypothetical protein
MRIDMENFFSRLQADIRNADTYEATYPIDMAVIGDSVPCNGFVVFRVGTAFVGGTNLICNVITDSGDDLATVPVILGTTGLLLTAVLTINKIIGVIPVGPGMKRYLGANYVSTGTFSAGTIDGFFVPGPRSLFPEI